MFKLVAGIVTIDGEKSGCFVEKRDRSEYAHLLNGDCYMGYECDELILLPAVLEIDFEKMCKMIEEQHI